MNEHIKVDNEVSDVILFIFVHYLSIGRFIDFTQHCVNGLFFPPSEQTFIEISAIFIDFEVFFLGEMKVATVYTNQMYQLANFFLVKFTELSEPFKEFSENGTVAVFFIENELLFGDKDEQFC